MRIGGTNWNRLSALLAVLMLASCHGASVHRARPGHGRGDGLETVSADDLFDVAIVYANRGDWLRAEQYLSAARVEGYEEASVVYWLVRVCVAAGRYQSALNHAETHLTSHPEDAGLRLVVASLLEALGDQDRARYELEQMLRIWPKNSLAHYRLALLYLGIPTGHDRAANHFEAYLALDPSGAHAAEARAKLEEETGP